MTVNYVRLAEIDHLASGSHQDHDAMCVMEAVAYVAGEPWSDHPECACPVITEFTTAWNDSLNDADRQRLVPYISRLVGTRSSVAVETRRGRLCSDWLIRTFTPAWLRLAGMVEDAAALEGLGDTSRMSAGEISERVTPIVSAAVSAARSAADSAADSAARSAARSAALSAARSAACSAARSAACSAADSAALSAADSAARSAARSAALSAAYSAARSAACSASAAALQPVAHRLQTSAFALLDQLIDAGTEL